MGDSLRSIYPRKLKNHEAGSSYKKMKVNERVCSSNYVNKNKELVPFSINVREYV